MRISEFFQHITSEVKTSINKKVGGFLGKKVTEIPKKPK